MTNFMRACYRGNPPSSKEEANPEQVKEQLSEKQHAGRLSEVLFSLDRHTGPTPSGAMTCGVVFV